MKRISLILAAVLTALLPSFGLAQRNILLISLDDMRDHPQAITPNLDAFAQQATVYTNAYTTALWCLPSRTTAMFGISPGKHRIGLHSFYGNAATPEHQAVYGNPVVRSLPELFSDQGYTSAVTGKVFHISLPNRWDINGPDGTYGPDQLTFEGPLAGFIDRGVFPSHLMHPDQASALWAADFLSGPSSRQAPFFLAVGFNLPHYPLIPPQWAYDMYDGVPVRAHSPKPDDLNDLPAIAVETYTEQVIFKNTPNEISLHELVLDTGEADDITLAYLASITHTDAMIQIVLDALANSPHATTTDVIIWSDHGFQLGEKFRWGKVSFHEPTARVPFMIKARAIPAREVTTPVSLLDLAPTVIDLAWGGTNEQFDGVSLVSSASPVEVFHEDGVATVDDSTKLINYRKSIGGPSHIETYNLLADPEELTNLSPPPPLPGR